MDVNRVTILGRLAADVNVWTSPSGAKVARFTLALNRQYHDSITHRLIKKVSWVPVAVWGTRVGPCKEYLRKGSLVFVEGYIETGSYTDKDGKRRQSMHVNAGNVKFLTPKGAKAIKTDKGAE